MSSSVSSLLSSIGLGGQSPAAAAADASALATQQAQAVSGITSSLNMLNQTITAGKMIGVSSDSLDKLTKASTDGQALLAQAATMSPTQLAAKANDYKIQTTTAMFSTNVSDYNTGLQKMQTMRDTISGRVSEVNADVATSPGLLSQYAALLKDIDKSLATWKANSPIDFAVRQATSGSSGSESNTAYALPSTPSHTDYQEQLDNLDGLKETEENGAPVSFSRMFRRFKNWTYVYLYYSLYMLVIVSSMIVGGIISANAYVEAEQGYTPNRLFYFFYGMIGFPFSIAAGCIKPPFWVSSLFPLSQRVPAVQAGGFLSPAQAVASLKVVAPFAAAGTAGPDTVLGALGVPTASSVAAAAAADAAVTTSRKAAAAAAAAPPPKESATNILIPKNLYESLFTFVVVDSKNPAPYQKTGKKHLWYMALLHAGLLASFVGVNNLAI
jgi:hypothetical protein